MDFTAGLWAVISLGMERIPGLSSPEFSVGSALCSSQGCALVVQMGWEGSLDLGMLPVERHLAGRCLWHQPGRALVVTEVFRCEMRWFSLPAFKAVLLPAVPPVLPLGIVSIGTDPAFPWALSGC